MSREGGTYEESEPGVLFDPVKTIKIRGGLIQKVQYRYAKRTPYKRDQREECVSLGSYIVRSGYTPELSEFVLANSVIQTL